MGFVLGALIKCFKRYKYGTIMALILRALITGLVIGGVYIRTGNLFLPILLHFISDFAAYFFDVTFMTALDASAIIIKLIVGIMMTVFLLRKYWCPGCGIAK